MHMHVATRASASARLRLRIPACRRLSTPAIFDHIVVGSGSAGAVVASRLSEDANRSVLLLEAGLDDSSNPIFRVPLLSVVYGVLFSKWYNYRYHTEGEPHLHGRSIYQPRGKVIGGSSSINGMIWVRGHPRDYDEWAKLTEDPSWSYKQFVEYFRRCEDACAVAGDSVAPTRGTGGPMHVSNNRWAHPLSRAFISASFEALGLEETASFNAGDNTEGVGFFELNQKDGVRWGTAAAYLSAPVRRRPNLTILSGKLATKLLLERDADGRTGNTSYGEHIVTGIEYASTTRSGAGTAERRVAMARESVTICAGVFNTPQLLMLSGIGPAEYLATKGIQPRVDLAGVSAASRIPSPGPRTFVCHKSSTSAVICCLSDGTSHNDVLLLAQVGSNLQDHLDVAVSVSNPSREALGLSASALPTLAGRTRLDSNHVPAFLLGTWHWSEPHVAGRANQLWQRHHTSG